MATWKAPNDPTVYGKLPIDFTHAADYLEKINRNSPVRITVTHLIAKGVALVLKKFPDLNGIIRWKTIYMRKTVDVFLQVAVDSKGGDEQPDLSGAKIESCDEKSLAQIAGELRDKSGNIRTKKDPQFRGTLNLIKWIPNFALSWAVRFISFVLYNLGLSFPSLGLPADPFGSVMVTSVGMWSVPSGFAPLVPMSRVPLVICVGEVKDEPVVIEGKVVVRPILDLSVTFDHRFIDGLTGSRMAKYFRDIIEKPDVFLSN